VTSFVVNRAQLRDPGDRIYWYVWQTVPSPGFRRLAKMGVFEAERTLNPCRRRFETGATERALWLARALDSDECHMNHVREYLCCI
jgi:hypothetical protein